MGNPHKGEVPLEIDGTSYRLKFDFNAICTAESFGSKNFLDLAMAADAGNMSALRVLFLASLGEQVSDMTLQQAGHLVQKAGIAKALQAVIKAVSLAFPPGKAKGDENP